MPPYYFIIPVWLVLLLLALPLFFIRRWRFLGTHIALAATMAVVGSWLLSTLAWFVAPQGRPAIWLDEITSISLYGVWIVVGGFAGLVSGIMLARKLNERLAWWPRPPVQS